MTHRPNLKPGKPWAHLRLDVDSYDKSWLTDATVGECRHASSLATETGTVRDLEYPGAAHNLADDLPPLMGHSYRGDGPRRQTEWRCQKCGVLWEENRANPQWCGALGGAT